MCDNNFDYTASQAGQKIWYGKLPCCIATRDIPHYGCALN